MSETSEWYGEQIEGAREEYLAHPAWNGDVIHNAFADRLVAIKNDITLPDNFDIRIHRDPEEEGGKWFVQIMCWRRNVITGNMGWGYGGKGYPSTHATDSELVQMIFGLYKGYVEHEARETFQWQGRRVFGPHISVYALHDIANNVDVRQLKPEEES